jgi:eukaryotic-like serine/threonine-protein kinase
MNRPRREQVEALFEAALDHPTAGRSGFVRKQAAGDEVLASAVEALLAGHFLEGGAVDKPIVALAEPHPAAGQGDRRIGPYRVLRELGRGGMGVVYLAERVDGQYRRRVAIKLLRSSPDADELHRRFLAERQILASLDHPHIALLLDGGVTDGRLPYLVMEYVDGLPITAYCDRHRLPIRARLRLFLDVCAAVHHAHQNLIIHRDLKPGNILVTQTGKVKLLDFGIAKLLNPGISAIEQPLTRTEFRVMTPEYASPEQIQGDSLTTTSDVYALGVVLYELLCGHPPYRLSGHTPRQIAELVCEKEPERPSSRVLRAERVAAPEAARTQADPAAISSARDASPERLRRTLRGDLDAIVMMALRKEPGGRYSSAELLGQDIQRYLDGLAVSAHVGNRRYRIGKFLRRHRMETAAAALAAMSLLIGAGVAAWEANIAVRERYRAEAAAAQAEEVTDFLMSLFRSGETDPETPVGDVSARDLLRRGVARAERLVNQPTVHARMLDVIGQMQHDLGEFRDAQWMLERAVAIRRALGEPGALDLAQSLLNLAAVHRSRSEQAEARPLVEEALAIRRRALPADHPQVADAVYELGLVAATNRELEARYREALVMLQRTGAMPERQLRLLNGLATSLRRQGRYAEAVASDREALRLAEREFGPQHFRTGYAMIHLGDQVRDLQQDLDAAERLYRRGLELMREGLGDDHLELVHGLGALAEVLARRGEHAEAERLLREALRIRVGTLGDRHPVVARSQVALALALERQGRREEAEIMVREALEVLRNTLGREHRVVAGVLLTLAQIVAERGRVAEADTLYREAVELGLPRDEEQQLANGEMRRVYGRFLTGQRRFVDAQQQLLRSLRMLTAAYGSADHPNPLETRRALMELYSAWGRPELVEFHRAPPGQYFRY